MAVAITKLATTQQLADLLPLTPVSVVLFTAYWSADTEHARTTLLRAAARLRSSPPPLYEVQLRNHVLHLQPRPPTQPSRSANPFWPIVAAAAQGHSAHRHRLPMPSPMLWSLPWLPSVNFFSNVSQPFLPHTFNDSFDPTVLARRIDVFCQAALSDLSPSNSPSAASNQTIPLQSPTSSSSSPSPPPLATETTKTSPSLSTETSQPPPRQLPSTSPCPHLSASFLTRDSFAAALSRRTDRAVLIVLPAGADGVPSRPNLCASLHVAIRAGWAVNVADAEAEPALAKWAGLKSSQAPDGSEDQVDCALVLIDAANDRVVRRVFARNATLDALTDVMMQFDREEEMLSDSLLGTQSPVALRPSSSSTTSALLAELTPRSEACGLLTHACDRLLLDGSAARNDREESLWLVIYASWCGHSQRMLAEANALGAAAKVVDGVGVVTHEGVEGLPEWVRRRVDGYPTTFYVRRRRGWTSVEEYIGPRDAVAMAEFENEETSARLLTQLKLTALG